jgi:hypothetical protein
LVLTTLWVRVPPRPPRRNQLQPHLIFDEQVAKNRWGLALLLLSISRILS